jgi:hypothetical protein
MTFRFGDQSVVVDLPKFVAADTNAISRSAKSRVRSDQRSMKRSHVSSQFQFVECDDHVRQVAYESARDFRDCCPSNRRCVIIHLE